MNKLFNFISYKIFNFFYYFKYKINYNEKLQINHQEKKFLKFNLNRNLGLQKLNQLKILYNFLQNPSSSEHQIIFSSLAIEKNDTISNILEIGTYDGSNAFLLSKLFPSASITTIDLKDNNQDFLNFYNRSDPKKLEEFIKKRNQLLDPIKKISFVQQNSINLINENKKFDLIWVDGAHGYPVVTVDIANSIRLLSNGGIMMCDDVFINKNRNMDKMYNSIATFETLDSFKEEGLIDFELFFKRINKSNNAVPKYRKFIAYVYKNF
jgi:predicted O-methyltransferase YrrM